LLVTFTIAPPSARTGSSRWVGTLEDHAVQPVEGLLGGLRKRRGVTEAGVVDDVVDLGGAPAVADRRGHLFDEGREGGAVADVERERDGLAAAGLDGRDGLGRAAALEL
jgi:hypothetical protein